MPGAKDPKLTKTRSFLFLDESVSSKGEKHVNK